MKYDTATPYITSYIIVRKQDKIAFVLRENTKWMNGYYGLPSGKVEKRESFSTAAVREALEEIGIAITPANLKFVHVMHRIHPEDNEWVDIFFEPLAYEGEPYNAEAHVHSELAWLDPVSLPDNVVPYVRFAIGQIQAGKLYSEFGWSKTGVREA